MKTKYDKWLAELRIEIGLMDTLACDPIARLKLTLPLISTTINDMRKEIAEHGFENEAGEIHFFKHIKPAFYALQIYEVDMYNLVMNRPIGTAEMLRAYYEGELLYVIRLYRIHAFHYQYFRMGATDLDSQYFMRNGRPSDIPVLEGIEIDPGFSTPLDYLFAKFIAAERYQQFLLEQLSNGFVLPAEPAKSGPVIRWTGEAINLVEVAYGLWLTGQLNDGNATVTDIVLWLEDKLSVRIGVPSRRWNEISGRTHSSPTKFLDRMRESIKQRIDEELGIRERKRKARRN